MVLRELEFSWNVCVHGQVSVTFLWGGGGGFDSLHHQQLSKQVVCVLPLTRPTYGGIIYYEKCAEHVFICSRTLIFKHKPKKMYKKR